MRFSLEVPIRIINDLCSKRIRQCTNLWTEKIHYLCSIKIFRIKQT